MHGLFRIHLMKRLCVGLMSEIEFKTTVTLVESESYSLCKGSSRKTPLFMHNLIEASDAILESIFKFKWGIVGNDET